MAIRRGTTDCIEIEMPYAVAQVEDGYLTITQLGNVIREDKFDDGKIILQDGCILLPLTQEDTLAFPTGAFKMQVRMLLTNGEAVASSGMNGTTDDVDKGGVI